MTKAYVYLRTSGDDGKEKAGIPVQRDACASFAAKTEFEIVAEFADDGVTGKLPMHARPQGKLLIAALLGNGVKVVLCYDAKRIGRTQPAFWSFAGMCRDNGIALLAADGTNLLDSVQGGIHGLMAEMDRDATVARLAAGKRVWRGKRRVEGRWPFGQHPSHDYDAERALVARIEKMHARGGTLYGIAKQLNAEGIRTRYGKEFRAKTISNILERRKSDGDTDGTNANERKT
jgi:DNA invertase Pin-like site-specific DNA recombinase